MLEFTIGAYLAATYTHAYTVYNSRIWEPLDPWDILFFVLAPITYPVCFISSLIKPDE